MGAPPQPAPEPVQAIPVEQPSDPDPQPPQQGCNNQLQVILC